MDGGKGGVKGLTSGKAWTGEGERKEKRKITDKEGREEGKGERERALPQRSARMSE